ncbi:MAG: citrate synthase/methylcitrate synthase [Chloroflexota bacterium]
MQMLNESEFKPGLEGVIAAETKLSRVNGQLGELIIGGYPLEIIAQNATFEEMVYLLWNGERPTGAELNDFQQNLASKRELPQPTLDLLKQIAKNKTPGMDALRMAAGTVDLDQPNLPMRQAAELALARMPTIVAAYHRLVSSEHPIQPDASLSHAANYLYMLMGDRPTEAQTKGMETYLNTVVDHGLNASTFTARVIIATQSDMVSAVVGAIGALKGPLHGGAPGPALDMVFEIGEAEKAEAYLRQKIGRGERLMGFGHRVYKVRDPRADVLGAAAEKMFLAMADESPEGYELYQLALAVEEKAIALLEEYKPGRKLQTNVEFYTALLLHGLGLPTDIFAPTFAISRTAGWLAHCFEQLETGRLIRPKARFVGEIYSTWE